MQDHFDYFYREYDDFIFPMTIHPDVSGRPHVLLMHERLIEHINKHEGVEWVTMAEVVDDFKAKNKPAEGRHDASAARWDLVKCSEVRRTKSWSFGNKL